MSREKEKEMDLSDLKKSTLRKLFFSWTVFLSLVSTATPTPIATQWGYVLYVM